MSRCRPPPACADDRPAGGQRRPRDWHARSRDAIREGSSVSPRPACRREPRKSTSMRCQPPRDHLVTTAGFGSDGVNHVRARGLSVPSRPIMLVGTMNPEEGELRPQLLDRFALMVRVSGSRSLDDRVEVVAPRMAFERDAGRFVAPGERWIALSQRIARATRHARPRQSGRRQAPRHRRDLPASRSTAAGRRGDLQGGRDFGGISRPHGVSLDERSPGAELACRPSTPPALRGLRMDNEHLDR